MFFIRFYVTGFGLCAGFAVFLDYAIYLSITLHSIDNHSDWILAFIDIEFKLGFGAI